MPPSNASERKLPHHDYTCPSTLITIEHGLYLHSTTHRQPMTPSALPLLFFPSSFLSGVAMTRSGVLMYLPVPSAQSALRADSLTCAPFSGAGTLCG
jgi:hypothetical protein